ncbi:putative acyl--CoA ligase YdaB [Lucilia sericata]|uniref:putative acyl--CoA ligase YdaB n=1 Tax=Lucilia sericata TaxID=13632 RepID=UPI0018A80398|nr:putative acyl--CoA ligase YdaB [Lucilia sericata]
MSKNFLKVNYDQENKIWKSANYRYKKQTNRTVGEAFLQSMRSLERDKVLEYHYDVEKEKCVKDLYQESIIVAKNLQRLGMQKGDVVMLFSGYNYWTSSLTFGTLLVGGVVNYFEVKLDNENIDKMFDIIQPFMILYEYEFLEKILKSLKRQKPKTLKYLLAIDRSNTPNISSELLKSSGSIDFDQFQTLELNCQLEVAFLVLTSGSTGLPKVTQLSHCLLLNGVYVWWANDYNYEPINSNSLLFSLSPLRWISQVVLLLQSALLGIKRISANKAATGAYGLEILRKTKPTHIFAVPSFFYELLLQLKEDDKKSLDSLKYIQLGGEPPSKVIINLTKTRAVYSKLFYSYGMSEVSCSITNNEHISGGKLQPGFEMQVLDEQLKPLAHNENGRLAIRTPYPFVGYKGENNSKYFLDNGFFLNGDYGYFDENNTLHFLARLKDLIKYQNVLLIPNLVETLVLQLPEISGVCLVGYCRSVEDPNEVAALFVVLKEGVSSSFEEISLKIRNILSNNLSDDQVLLLHDIYVRESFPLTTCGKIDRIALRKLALKGSQLN